MSVQKTPSLSEKGARLLSSRTFWFVTLLLIGLTFQLLMWVHTSGYVDFSIGDDQGGYIFLGATLAGEIPATPTFTFRTPGWPLLIAGVMRAFGPSNLWTIGLVNRLMLSCYPALIFLILTAGTKRSRTRYSIAAALSLIALILPVQYLSPPVPTTDMPFNFMQLAIIAVVANLSLGSKNLKMSTLLGVLLLIRTMVRLQGAGSSLLVIGLVAAFSALLWEQRRTLVKQLFALGGPLLIGVFLLGLYNFSTTGTFGLYVGNFHSLFYYVRSVGNRNVFVPKTQEIEVVRSMVPTIPNSVMPLSSYRGSLHAYYNAGPKLGISRLQFAQEYGSPATLQFIRTNAWPFVSYVLKWISYDLVEFEFNPYSTYQYKSNGSTNILSLWLDNRYTDADLASLESMIADIPRPAIPELPVLNGPREYGKTEYPLALEEFRFLYSGMAGLFFLALIIFGLRKWMFGFTLLAFYVSDLAIPAVFCGDCVTQARFQYNMETAALIAVLFLIYSVILLLLNNKSLKS